MSKDDSLRDLIERGAGLHDKLGNCHPKLARGTVWCRSCGRSQSVSSAHAMKHGWPKCCSATMTIDSPEEREALSAAIGEPEGALRNPDD